ncbi:MAG: prepilin-type N-terminal cleavage/methylation domain-containing protein [Pseudomonadota bacterium]
MSLGRSKAQAGFSLLELLVAVTIMGLLGSLMAAGIRFGLNAWTSGSARLENTSEHYATVALLRRQLSGAAPRVLKKQNDQGRSQAVAAFWGTRDQVTFVAVPPQILPDQRDTLVTFFVSPDHKLMTKLKPFTSRNLSLDETPATVLEENVESVELRYYGRPSQQSIAGWYTTWQGYARLPELVELRIQRANADQDIRHIFNIEAQTS